jgi:hypothetical protein
LSIWKTDSAVAKVFCSSVGEVVIVPAVPWKMMKVLR